MSKATLKRFDLVIIGGGINGAGIARDAAGRGLRVLLCEKDDLASATSSASTKLIHGGLRYLEHFEFRLVREALKEREVLLRAAPHIIWPLRFVLPHNKSMRSRALIRLGLFLYDHLAKREKLPGSKHIRLGNHAAGKPLQDNFEDAFLYSDCWVEDARLVALNAQDAYERGADIRTRTQCVSASRKSDGWEVSLHDREQDTSYSVHCKALVNAAGPWVKEVLDKNIDVHTSKTVRLVKGSHIVVEKLYEGDHAYIFQNADKRIVFAIPYEGNFTLIGTTDMDYSGDPNAASISDSEREYLLNVMGLYFKDAPPRENIVWEYSGVRPLYLESEQKSSQKASAITRDYVFDLDTKVTGAPLLSIFGGKITTYRKLAEHATGKICDALQMQTLDWTADIPLPGGDMPGADFDAFCNSLRQTCPWLPETLVYRYARAYGTNTKTLIGDAQSILGLGKDLGGDVYEAELEYVRDHEFARTGEDFLWRRSKLGLHLDSKMHKVIIKWFEKHRGASAFKTDASKAPIPATQSPNLAEGKRQQPEKSPKEESPKEGSKKTTKQSGQLKQDYVDTIVRQAQAISAQTRPVDQSQATSGQTSKKPSGQQHNTGTLQQDSFSRKDNPPKAPDTDKKTSTGNTPTEEKSQSVKSPSQQNRSEKPVTSRKPTREEQLLAQENIARKVALFNENKRKASALKAFNMLVDNQGNEKSTKKKDET